MRSRVKRADRLISGVSSSARSTRYDTISIAFCFSLLLYASIKRKSTGLGEEDGTHGIELEESKRCSDTVQEHDGVFLLVDHDLEDLPPDARKQDIVRGGDIVADGR